MTDPDDAIDRFLRKADDAYGEYEQGYADADATLRRLKRHIETLRDDHDA
jgi:phage shock protein A